MPSSCSCYRVVGRTCPSACSFPLLCFLHGNVKSSLLSVATAMNNSQLSAMDVSVRSTMKGAAKCDKHCELQNSVNRQGLERILCFWDIPESMPSSVSMLYCSSSFCHLLDMLLRVLVPQELYLLRHPIDRTSLRRPTY